MIPRPPTFTLFPYTTLFRSLVEGDTVELRGADAAHQARQPQQRRGALLGSDLPTDLLPTPRSEEHTSELQSRGHLVCRLLLEKKNRTDQTRRNNSMALRDVAS